MLEILDRFSLYIAVAIIGYLTYTTMEQKGFSLDVEKEMPEITKKMLNPELIEPNDHASPAGRDPFEVSWATYYDISQLTGQAALTDNTTAGQNYEPQFDKMLMGILTTGDGEGIALIDGKIYEAGALIDGNDPNTCWKIDSIYSDEVIVTFGKKSKALMVSGDSVFEYPSESEYPEEVEQ